MSKDRFVERQAEVSNAVARLREAAAELETSIVRYYSPLLSTMAARIQTLVWE